MNGSEATPCELSPAVREFLDHGRPIATLATTRKNGHPWLQPLWFLRDANELLIVLVAESIAGRCVQRTGRATLCVDDEAIPYRFVVLECTVEIDESEPTIRSWLFQMVERYRPDIDAQAETDAYLELKLLAITLHPERVYFQPQVVDLPVDS